MGGAIYFVMSIVHSCMVPQARDPARPPDMQASPTASPSSTWWRHSAPCSTGERAARVALGIDDITAAIDDITAAVCTTTGCNRLPPQQAGSCMPPCLPPLVASVDTPCDVPHACRERAAGMYSVYAFSLAQLLVEVPYLIVQATVYVSMVYW